jgi:hypothetical protein
MAKASNDVVETPSVVERLKGIGVTIPARERRTIEYMQKYVVSEIERWIAPIKAAGVTAD